MRIEADGIEGVGEAKDATPLGRLGDGRARGREIRDGCLTLVLVKRR